jgi:hypothetical protein
MFAFAGVGAVLAAVPVVYLAVRPAPGATSAPKPDARTRVGFMAPSAFTVASDDARSAALCDAASEAANSIAAGDAALMTTWPDTALPTFDDLISARLQGWQITGQIDPLVLDTSGPKPIVRCSVSVALMRWPTDHYPHTQLLRAVASTREDHVETASSAADDVARAETDCVRKRVLASTAELLHWTKL